MKRSHWITICTEKCSCVADTMINSDWRKLIASGVLLAVTGCGQYGGGASVVPDVIMVSADLGAAPTEGGEAGAATDAAAPATTEGGFGVFQGQVVLAGSAPSIPLKIKAGADVKDKEVCSAVDMPDEKLMVDANGGVANVFVYMAKAPAGGKPVQSEGEDIIFDQKNCRFFPHCLLVPVGRTVRVLSDDPIAHNTHTYPSKNDGVNSGVAPNERTGVLNFKYRRAETVPLAVTCDYHAWMKAWHLPVDHPYAAVTDAEGRFSIADLPAGSHSFSVWHESVQGNFVERKLTVTVKAGESTEMKIDLPVEKLAL